MLATEEHKKSQRGALDFGIAGLNSRESRAYTIQGWIKGVNSNTMSAVRDPGRDGDLSLGGNTHAKVATDAFGYTLGYFAGDYNPIGTFTTAGKSEASTAGSDLLAARSDLWNGNISHMVTCLPKATDYAANQTITPEAFGSAYQYDQLNRLSSSRAFTNINTTTNQWQSGAGTNPSAYATDYTYDAMGNILTQKRNGGGASATALDELTYNYHTTTDGLVSNRLYQVNDVVSAGNYTDDIDDQGTFNNTHSTIETANNYGYDELGNLVRDVQEEIASIEWTVYGKMKKITRNSSSSKADLEFGYDASGNRLWKKVTPKGSGAVISTYYYLRDAQGNEMCRYVKYTNTSSQLMYVAQEHSIYGSSRVGVDGRKDTLYKAGSYSLAWGGVSTSRRELGLKSFELANHLGNVLVTVSDKPVYKVSSTTIFFQPEITSISDYYPFGAPINGRSYSSTEYRFGFNTQEKDDEVAGPGNHNTATFWEYDTRLGRRWNQDPKFVIGVSPYAINGDNPIFYTDPNGDFKRKFSAQLYKFLHGGKVEKDANNEYYVNKSFSDQNDVVNIRPRAYDFMGNPKYDHVGGGKNSSFWDNLNIGRMSALPKVLGQIANAKSAAAQGGGGSVYETAVPVALTAAAVDGPLPIGDIIGGVILAGATAYDATQRTFVTYTMRNAAGQTYVGRTSGYGDPYSIITNRAAGHHMKAFGYGNPILDRAVQGYQGYPAIRGREQQLIDFYGGVGSPGVGNSIRGVSPYNPAYPIYHGASNLYFGPLAPYTGY